MKYKITLAAAGLLGLVFVVFGLNFFLNFIPMPSPPEGSPAAAFMGAMYSTGYLTFVKILEITGGILVAIPKTRNIGLLLLGPIVINILAFNVFIAPGGYTQPPVILVSALSAFLLWSARASFAKLIN
ncbi:MAG: hypothetical protein P1U86_10640 [Verrucomicrobiales bacterium]|nr:hypothetical protein [Verrucomicrobiales bacterium]